MLLRKLKEYVKKFLWFYVPYDKEVKIKYCLSRKFRKHVQEIRSRFSNHESVPVPKKPGKRLCVVFMCQSADVWNSVKSIYLAAKKDKDIDTYILAIPEKIMHENYNVNHEEYDVNRAYAMCSKFDRDTISAHDYDSKTWFDLKSLEPDYVFIPRPYDIHLPPCYRSDEVRKYAKVCLWMYACSLTTWAFKLLGVNFMMNCSLIFAQSEYHENLLNNILRFFHASDIKAKFLGFPRFDLFSNNTQLGGGKTTEFRKTVMWLPRWTTNGTVETTTFFRYKDSIIKYFLEHKDLKLICRPHPLMIRNFLSTGQMTQADVNAFMKLFREEKNFMYDDNPDYIPALMESDIFVSDWTSLLIEEFITEKPIIYLGRHSTLSSEAKEIASMFYPAGNETHLFRHLESLIENHDSMKQKRHEYITQKMKHDGKAGERIMQFIKEDFKA